MVCRTSIEYRINARFYSYTLELSADSSNCEEAMKLVSSTQFTPQLIDQAVKLPRIIIEKGARPIIELISNVGRTIRLFFIKT